MLRNIFGYDHYCPLKYMHSLKIATIFFLAVKARIWNFLSANAVNGKKKGTDVTPKLQKPYDNEFTLDVTYISNGPYLFEAVFAAKGHNFMSGLHNSFFFSPV